MLEIVTDPAHLLALGPEWKSLEARAARPDNVFQSFAWCGTWARHYLADSPVAELATLIGRRDGELVLVWPLMIDRHGPFRVLKWLSDPFGQYGDVLVSPDIDPDAWLAPAWRRLKSLPGLDSVSLRHVRADAAIHPFLAASCATSIAEQAAPWLDLSAFADPEAYDGRYTREQRRRRRRIRRSLEGFGPLGFRLDTACPAYADTIAAGIAEKRRWLSERGLVSPVIEDARLPAFLGDLDGGFGVASTLSCGNRPAAFEIALHYGNCHFSYLTAHDRVLRDFSPARLHMDCSQKWCLENGLNRFDLMVPSDDHKRTWSNAAVTVRDFLSPVSHRGRIYAQLYLRRLRPLARRAYLGLDRRLRRPLTATLTPRRDGNGGAP